MNLHSCLCLLASSCPSKRSNSAQAPQPICRCASAPSSAICTEPLNIPLAYVSQAPVVSCSVSSLLPLILLLVFHHPFYSSFISILYFFLTLLLVCLSLCSSLCSSISLQEKLCSHHCSMWAPLTLSNLPVGTSFDKLSKVLKHMWRTLSMLGRFYQLATTLHTLFLFLSKTCYQTNKRPDSFRSIYTMLPWAWS